MQEQRECPGWGEQCEGTSFQHVTREVVHDWFGLDVEIAKHLITSPMAKETDNIRIHMGRAAKEGHCTCCSEGTSADVFWEKSKARARQCGGGPEEVGNVSGRYRVTAIVKVASGVSLLGALFSHGDVEFDE